MINKDTSYFVAFLRGINVGGNKKIKMADLKKLFEIKKLTDVKTILNSGNVVFRAKENINLESEIEKQIEKKFGFHSDVIIRSKEHFEKLIDSEPFKNVTLTKDTRLYVTLMKIPHKSKIQTPYLVKDGSFEIIKITESEICSVLKLSTNKNTTDFMKFMEKEFGTNITTRNWNTIERIVKI